MCNVGNDCIVWKDFLVGIAPLISGTHSEKIQFGFALYDTNDKKVLKGSDLFHVLCQMNLVASYFGDPVMKEDDILTLVCEVQNLSNKNDALSTTIAYDDLIEAISNHPVVTAFISGQGTTMYGLAK